MRTVNTFLGIPLYYARKYCTFSPQCIEKSEIQSIKQYFKPIESSKRCLKILKEVYNFNGEYSLIFARL